MLFRGWLLLSYLLHFQARIFEWFLELLKQCRNMTLMGQKSYTSPQISNPSSPDTAVLQLSSCTIDHWPSAYRYWELLIVDSGAGFTNLMHLGFLACISTSISWLWPQWPTRCWIPHRQLVKVKPQRLQECSQRLGPCIALGRILNSVGRGRWVNHGTFRFRLSSDHRLGEQARSLGAQLLRRAGTEKPNRLW